MKPSTLGMAVAVAVVLSSTAAFAGHYNSQLWRFYTNDCEPVAWGGHCVSITLEVSASTWCGSSCSWSEKTATFNKAMNAFQSYWSINLQSLGFRERVTPVCSTYLPCESFYVGGYYDDTLSIKSMGDYNSDSRGDEVVREFERYNVTKL